MKPNLMHMVNSILKIAEEYFHVKLDVQEVATFLDDILWKNHSLWQAQKEEIITLDELACAIADHAYDYLIHKKQMTVSHSDSDMQNMILQIRNAISKTLESS